MTVAKKSWFFERSTVLYVVVDVSRWAADTVASIPAETNILVPTVLAAEHPSEYSSVKVSSKLYIFLPTKMRFEERNYTHNNPPRLQYTMILYSIYSKNQTLFLQLLSTLNEQI